MKRLSRCLSLFAVALLMCLALPAQAGPVVHPFDVTAPTLLAQADAPPAPSVFQSVLSAVTTPEAIATGIALLGGALGLLLNSVSRKRRVALAAYHAFHIVEDIDAERGDGKLDKVVAGLKAADDWMKANGWRPLKPGEQEAAKLAFTSLNGQQQAAVKVQAQALVAAQATASP